MCGLWNRVKNETFFTKLQRANSFIVMIVNYNRVKNEINWKILIIQTFIGYIIDFLEYDTMTDDSLESVPRVIDGPWAIC